MSVQASYPLLTLPQDGDPQRFVDGLTDICKLGDTAPSFETRLSLAKVHCDYVAWFHTDISSKGGYVPLSEHCQSHPTAFLSVVKQQMPWVHCVYIRP